MKEAKFAVGLTLFAILKVSRNPSVFANCKVKGGSVATLDQETFAGELLCQPTGVWRLKA